MMRLISRIRERQEFDDEGFSILELMMALTILMVGIIAILGTLIVATKASGLQRHRLNAVQVANESMEKIRAEIYFNVALDPGDPNLSERPAPTMTPPPTEMVTATDTIYSIPVAPPQINRDGVVFDIRVNVLWVSYLEPNPPSYWYQHAYKHVVVRVIWSDQVGTHDYQVESDVYPGNLGAKTPDWCGGEPPAFPAAPYPPTNLEAEFALTDTTQASLTWNDNSSDECYFQWAAAFIPYSVESCSSLPEYVWIGQEPDLPFTMSDTASHYVTGLAPSTTYCYRVRAANMLGASSWTYSNPLVTAGPPSGASCTIQSVMVRSPADDASAPLYRIKLTNQNYSADSILIGVTVSGECSSLWLEVKTTKPTQTINIPLASYGGVWSTQIYSGEYKFATGFSNWMVGGTSVNPPDPANLSQGICFYKGSEC